MAWGQAYKSYFEKLLKLQKRALRFIYFSERNQHAIPLFIDASVLPLKFLYYELLANLRDGPLFFGGGYEKFSSANNIFKIYSPLQSFFPKSTFLQTIFFSHFFSYNVIFLGAKNISAIFRKKKITSTKKGSSLANTIADNYYFSR